MPALTTTELLTQFHYNQSRWIERLATAELSPKAENRRIYQYGNTLAVRPGNSGVIMLPVQGQFTEVMEEHEQVLTWLRRNHPHDVLMWGMHQNAEIDLAMLAQGYRVGFEPWWMTRDLTEPIPMPSHSTTIATSRDIEDLTHSDVPYITHDHVVSTRRLVANGHNEVVWVIARVEGRVVGQAIANITGDHAGLFNVGVSGRYRKRGIGTSLSIAAMYAARDRGAVTMNLNSTPMGKQVYERVGFQQFGVGQTWIRAGVEVNRNPDERLQRIITALGSGDLATLDQSTLPTMLPIGMTAQELAARFGRQDSLGYLVEQGQIPEIIALWDAGLREVALAATENVRARELVTGSRKARPIHLAVEKGAGTLVMALIEAGADLHARDGEYRATALDWAHACNKPTIARLIHRAGGR